jgi:CheY-like chemotaxis protein
MLQKNSILIVDDSGTNLFLLQSLLEDEGYPVMITEDPGEGLKYIKNRSDIGLILLDIMMPKFDGFEFMKKLSDSGKLSQIPVIMVTARDDRQSQKQAMHMGATAYLTKPLNLNHVIKTIHEQLG